MSKVMTRNPIFVTSDSLAIEALQKMAQGNIYLLCVMFQFVLSYSYWLCAGVGHQLFNVGSLF